MKSYAFRGISPQIHPSAYIFDDVVIIGDVQIEKNVSIWPGVTIRGDKEKIVIKEGSNVQEHSVLHADPGFPLVIEKNATIGHNVILHGCTVGSHTVVGIGSILLNGAYVGDNCLITAGSILSSGPRFASGSLISGSPAKVLMSLSESDIQNLRDTAKEYQDLAVEYRESLMPLNTR